MAYSFLYIIFVCCIIIKGSGAEYGTSTTKSVRPWLQYGPPRFRQNQRIVEEVFLNDKATFKCNALAKPAPKIHWYRNGEYLNYTMLSRNDRLRENKKHFSLEIRRVEVSDQGSWACKVWNQAGSIFRNFTLEIIDFCDYFLMHEYPPKRVPEKCICLWYLTGEYRKEGINWAEVNDARCEQYRRYASQLRRPLGKKICASPNCGEAEDPKGIGQPIVVSAHVSVQNEHVDRYSVGMQSSTPSADGEDRANSTEDENTKVLSLELPLQDQPRSNSSSDPDIVNATSMRAALVATTTPSPAAKGSTTVRPTTRFTFPPQKVPPYFKVRDEDAITSVNTPAGRTIKLQCKAGGMPEPQVIWINNHKKVITTELRRPVGAEYRLRKTTLEIEDVGESDSGNYTCEAFNSVGSVTRTFHLRVVERMRSKPIIVPNVLVNQTVDANSTVNFTCKVISDLTPHIEWIRFLLTNGSIFYWNETEGQLSFRYINMLNVENAIITKPSEDSSTLTIVNVTVADQGVYGCVTGNNLGYVSANATLTVNEFHAMTIATGDPDSERSWVSLLALCVLLLLAVFVIIGFLYLFCIRRNSKAQIAQMEQLVGPVKKRVVITKRPVDPTEADGWSDVPSTYLIHIEPIASAPHRRTRLSSDMTLLSDYEIPADPAWEVDRSRLLFLDMLGEGAFGEVWKAMLKPTVKSSSGLQADTAGEQMLVAVKRLKASAHEKELIDLVSEMETFKIIGQHANILRLIGCCTGSGPLYVILELCKHGNLRDFLRAHRPRDAESPGHTQDSPTAQSEHYLEPRKVYSKLSSATGNEERAIIKHLTQRHLVHFAWQIAKGMEFMASRKIIHRDLAARNVLVADDTVMKISDFGLSRDVHYEDYYRKKGNGRLPIKWMALEALDSHIYTIYSDVWSFGILLWEIMTLGGTPYPSIAMQQLYSCLKEGYRMEAPDNCPEEIYDVMVACWQEKPENRPSFDTLVDYFDWMLTQSAPDQENYLEVQSNASECNEELKTVAPPPPISESGSLLRRRKMRPLSEPIISPTEPINDDSGSESDAENESRPLLAGTKALLYTQQESPGVHYAFVRRSGGLPMLDPVKTSLTSEKKLNSMATMSVDSAIGSPLWPIGPNGSTSFDPTDPYITCEPNSELVERRLQTKEDSEIAEVSADVDSKAFVVDDRGKRDSDDETFANLNEQYVNVQNGEPTRGKLPPCRFPFPPSRHTRFSDSSAYEPDSVQLSMLNGAHNCTPRFNTAQCQNAVVSENRSALGDANGQAIVHQRRFSIDSNSSGRGGSSGMSSAEGLGGVADFCRIEYTPEARPAYKTRPSPVAAADTAPCLLSLQVPSHGEKPDSS